MEMEARGPFAAVGEHMNVVAPAQQFGREGDGVSFQPPPGGKKMAADQPDLHGETS
jgi:hypothetical protein